MAVLLKSFEQTLVVFQKHPRGIFFAVLVFFVLYWTRSFGEAIVGGMLALALFARLESRLFFLWALIGIAIIPVFYLADRPAQAERVGVVAFSLLGLGIVVNAIAAWRSSTSSVAR